MFEPCYCVEEWLEHLSGFGLTTTMRQAMCELYHLLNELIEFGFKLFFFVIVDHVS